MDGVEVIISMVGFFIAIYLISRVAHFFNNVKNKMNDIEKKLDDLIAFNEKQTNNNDKST